jgi:uncharacterized protein with HEPN domain
MRRDKLYISDMMEACSDIAEFIEDIDFDDFITDKLRTSAVLQKLMVIGEAATRISDDMQGKYPEVEWPVIAGMRNRLVHGYFAVEWPLVWTAVQDEVPVLRKRLQEIISADFK